MDSTEADDTAGEPIRKSSAERVRKHRRRQRKLELQVAIGIAKIVTGKGAGDQRRALLAVLEKAAKGRDIPDDVMSTFDEAIDKLKSHSVY